MNASSDVLRHQRANSSYTTGFTATCFAPDFFDETRFYRHAPAYLFTFDKNSMAIRPGANDTCGASNSDPSRPRYSSFSAFKSSSGIDEALASAPPFLNLTPGLRVLVDEDHARRFEGGP